MNQVRSLWTFFRPSLAPASFSSLLCLSLFSSSTPALAQVCHLLFFSLSMRACVSRNCRQHRFQLWSSCGNRKSWRKNLQPRRSFNGSISSLPISVRFVCVYLSVCICICISTGPSAVYPPPSLEDSYLPESAFSPDEEGSSSYGEPEYNFEYELTEPLLKEVGKNNLYDWICFWQYVDDNLQIPAEYRALKQGSASTQDALNEVT